MNFGYNEKLIGEFDDEKRILHLSAKEVIHVDTKDQLEELCSAVFGKLEKHISTDRCYMIVDLSKFIIEPELADYYAEKIQTIAQNCLYPNGLARHGYQITRMTVRLGYKENIAGDPNLFDSKRSAYDFIDHLIEQKLSDKQILKS